MPTFIASRVSSDQNALYPEMLEIDDYNVIYYKGYVLGYTTIVIARHNVASVSLSSGLFFADVIVSSKGGEWIRARGFSKSKAKEILSDTEEKENANYSRS